MQNNKKKILLISLSLLLAVFLMVSGDHIWLTKRLHGRIFGSLLDIEHILRPLPEGIKDIVLVTIDNETLTNMTEHWPYPRSDFARVIENLKKAEAKAIGFDFIFFGKSVDKDDILLKSALDYENRIALPAIINEEGVLDFSGHPLLNNVMSSGIITKFQDFDGVTRRNLTYLVNAQDPYKGFLSWEMQLLKATKGIDLSTLKSKNQLISFQNDKGEKWRVPVEPKTKTFLIHFRAHTLDFPRISFYRLLKGDFDRRLVKDKIVLIGMLSLMLADLHHTSIGWLPGITLNANAFLTLYTHDFLKDIPYYTGYIILIIAVILAAFSLAYLEKKKALLIIGVEIVAFFALSYILLVSGYTWNYSFFPTGVILCPFFSKKILDLIIKI